MHSLGLLEAVGGEVYATPRSVGEPDLNVAKVELGELAGHSAQRRV